MGDYTALISVSDKRGVVDFARDLVRLGFDILSTGGTRRALDKAGISAMDIGFLTGFPELMDGRVKTLHPKVHGGILARRGIDAKDMAKHGIRGIDLVAVDLYPFERTIARADCTLEVATEQIDIGGAAMLRSAAKNHRHVLVVSDPDDYPSVIRRLEADAVDAGYRLLMAGKAFVRTSAYDIAIAEYLTRK